MEEKIIHESQNLYHYNLNFTLDNFQIIVHDFMIQFYKSGTSCDTHQHSSYELHYIAKGEGAVHFCNTTHELTSGDLYLLAPNTPFSQRIYNEDITDYSLRFDIKRLSSYANNHTEQEECKQIIALLESSSNILFSKQHQIGKIFEQGYTEAFYKRPGYYIRLKQGIMNMIIKVARLSYTNHKKVEPYSLPPKSTEVAQIDIVTEYIRKNISSHITNNMIAQYVHISERQLHRLTKKAIGLSPHQYVNQLRINYIKSLLDKRIYSLKAISEMSGFSSEFHLSSAFKKSEKMTPREYTQKSAE